MKHFHMALWVQQQVGLLQPDKTRPLTGTQAKSEADFTMPKLYEGMSVLHARFGEGKVSKVFVNEKKLTVKFDVGEKTFIIDEKSDMNAFKRGYLKVKE